MLIGSNPKPETPDFTVRYRAVGDKVSFVMVKMPNQTSKGVIIPDSAQDSWSSPWGKVISVGKDCKEVKEGDTILLEATATDRITRILIDEQSTYVIQEKYITGVILPEAMKAQ